MSLYIFKVSEGLIQHVSVKKCKDEKKDKKKPPYEISHPLLQKPQNNMDPEEPDRHSRFWNRPLPCSPVENYPMKIKPLSWMRSRCFIWIPKDVPRNLHRKSISMKSKCPFYGSAFIVHYTCGELSASLR